MKVDWKTYVWNYWLWMNAHTNVDLWRSCNRRRVLKTNVGTNTANQSTRFRTTCKWNVVCMCVQRMRNDIKRLYDIRRMHQDVNWCRIKSIKAMWINSELKRWKDETKPIWKCWFWKTEVERGSKRKTYELKLERRNSKTLFFILKNIS